MDAVLEGEVKVVSNADNADEGVPNLWASWSWWGSSAGDVGNGR
jgi:hypothetical protein